MDLFPKFIIEGDSLILSKVSFHKDLVTDPAQVKGGGWFRMPKDARKIIFYGESHDFGPAKLEHIKECVKAGKVYSNKYQTHSLKDRHTFAYDTGCEVIELE